MNNEQIICFVHLAKRKTSMIMSKLFETLIYERQIIKIKRKREIKEQCRRQKEMKSHKHFYKASY